MSGVVVMASGVGDKDAGAALAPQLESRRERFRHEWWPKVRSALGQCEAIAERRREFGDLVVELWATPGLPVRIARSAQLGPDVQRCAVAALQDLARRLRGHLGEVAETGGIVSLGTIRPLLPSGQELLRPWLDASTAAAAGGARRRAALARRLPPDVRVGTAGCLDIAPTPYISGGVEAWLERYARPVDPLWLREARLPLLGEDSTSAHLVSIESGESFLITRTYFRRDGIATHTWASGTPRPRRLVAVMDRLCLVALDQAAIPAISAHLRRSGNCWVGEARDILVEPRFAFPRERTYRSVRSANDGRACAIDGAGRLTCCGRTTFEVGGAEAVVDFDVSPGTICTVRTGGQAGCAGLDDGRTTLTLPGTFTRVSSAINQACGLRSDGAAVCSASGIHAAPKGRRFRAVDARSSCGLDDGGGISCWSARDVTTFAGAQFSGLASAPDLTSSWACALDATGAPWCWDVAMVPARPRTEATAVRFATIDVAASQRCGVPRGSCAVQCWSGASPIPELGEDCLREISLGAPACGVSISGRVSCGGHPLWTAPTTPGRP